MKAANDNVRLVAADIGRIIDRLEKIEEEASVDIVDLVELLDMGTYSRLREARRELMIARQLIEALTNTLEGVCKVM